MHSVRINQLEHFLETHAYVVSNPQELIARAQQFAKDEMITPEVTTTLLGEPISQQLFGLLLTTEYIKLGLAPVAAWEAEDLTLRGNRALGQTKV